MENSDDFALVCARQEFMELSPRPRRSSCFHCWCVCRGSAESERKMKIIRLRLAFELKILPWTHLKSMKKQLKE